MYQGEKYMKTIGLIGGMSWESSIEYYRIINQRVAERLGGVHSAKSIMVSVDFAEIEVLQHQGRWDEAGEMLADAAQCVENCGADLLVICTNTMHKVAAVVQDAIKIPVLHIADATAARIKLDGLSRVGLLGTRFTMEEDFYRGRLKDLHELDVMVPGDKDRDMIHQVIYRELVAGKILPESRRTFLDIISKLEKDGAQGVILGCTEIGLLVKPADCFLTLYDTTVIHAEAAVDFALNI
jgi:aspartate racemase